jgi:hypothetical protein
LLQSLAEGAPGRISKRSLCDITSLLKELQTGGSRKLGIVLTGARHGLDHGWLLNILDITVE